tara:strand:+ start:42 stop:443 length:402 start_codon:yes stop_codon:yes gene_type:complete
MDYIWPSEEQWSYIQNQVDKTRPIRMLNLLKYKATADYSGHPGETPCSGKIAYDRYRKHALPLAQEYGGAVIFSGDSSRAIIGPETEHWDEVLLVEYPSVKAFVEMASSEKYQSFAYHRAAAVSDSRLVPMSV